MAKNSTTKTGGTSRIRFVMVDAEIADGDIGQITQAIQNALRGPSPSVVIKHIAAPAAMNNGATESQEFEEGEVQETNGVDVVDATLQPAKQRVIRKPAPTPNIIDIEMNNEVSLATFAQNKDSKSQHKKYLIAATWLKEHRNIDAISSDHIYTCFRSIGWPTNILDFAQPLRELKSKKYFTSPEKGLYAINHIGLDYVKKLGGNGAG